MAFGAARPAGGEALQAEREAVQAAVVDRGAVVVEVSDRLTP
jgi:hypothetical protein